MSASALLPKAIAGPQVALGRAGDGPRAFPGWEAASVALCGARGGDLRLPTFPRLAPPALGQKSQKFGLGRILKDFYKGIHQTQRIFLRSFP